MKRKTTKGIILALFVIVLTLGAGISVFAESVPVIKSAKVTRQGVITMTWTAVENASGYEVFYSTSGKNYQSIGTTTTTTEDIYAPEGKTYYLKVRAIVNSQAGGMSKAVKVKLKKASSAVDHFKKLVAGIRSTGQKSSSGKPCIYEKYTYEKMTFINEIECLSKGKKVRFRLTVREGSNCYKLNMILTRDSLKKKKATVQIQNKEGSKVFFKCTATVNLSKVKENCKLKYKFQKRKGITAKKATTYNNKILATNMSLWEALIFDNSLVSFKDLGFKHFDAYSFEDKSK